MQTLSHTLSDVENRIQGAGTLNVIHLGARRNYAVPRILHQANQLAHLHTDICASKGWPQVLNLIPKNLRNNSISKITNRVVNGVPPAMVTAYPGFGIEYAMRLRKARSRTEQVNTFLWAAKTFSKLILQKGIQGDAIYAFNTAGLEIMQAAHRSGLRTVMEQTIAPYGFEMELMQGENAAYPGWEEISSSNAAVQEYIERERQEWSIADLILCGSEFVKAGIQHCGGPVEKCLVVPYGVDPKFQIPPKQPHSGPLRVLTVGTVGLRKGIPYVLEAAKQLKGRATFRVVGPVQVSPDAAAQLSEHLELVGHVLRSQIVEQYAWADVFLLPSICEGSAEVTYEALSCGLPVITTANSGSIVEDGISGFIIPMQNSASIVDELESLLQNPDVLQKMSAAALTRSQYGHFANYADRLIAALK
jgi:glycosyltransferase involved in cell wall biosynthesis